MPTYYLLHLKTPGYTPQSALKIMLSFVGSLRPRRLVRIRLGFFGAFIPNASKVISVISYNVALRPSMVTTFSERYMPYTISIKSVLVPFHTNCGFSFFLGSAFLKTTAIFLNLFISISLFYCFFVLYILRVLLLVSAKFITDTVLRSTLQANRHAWALKDTFSKEVGRVRNHTNRYG